MQANCKIIIAHEQVQTLCRKRSMSIEANSLKEGVEDLSCLGWSRTKRRRKFRIGCDIPRSQSVVRLALSREKETRPEGSGTARNKTSSERRVCIRWIARASEKGASVWGARRLSFLVVFRMCSPCRIRRMLERYRWRKARLAGRPRKQRESSWKLRRRKSDERKKDLYMFPFNFFNLYFVT